MALGLGSKSLTWFDGKWHEGDHPVISATDHAAWLGSQVFDGARWFDGVTPDLDLHCARLLQSAKSFGMEPDITAEKLVELALEGVERFAPEDTALYIRPMMWARHSTSGIIDAEPDSAVSAMCIEEFPMPSISDYSLTVAPYRRPRQDMALTEAKASCLYPNNARISKWARDRGFSNALSLDIDDNVAETASSNVFAVYGKTVSTPEPTGCFLNGITRQRVIGLLRDNNVEVVERAMSVEDFEKADEIFVTGNIGKVTPVSRFQNRDLGAPKTAVLARELYFEYAHANGKPRLVKTA